MNGYGVTAYVLASLLLGLSIWMTILSRMDGEFRSGVYIVPTFFALAGTIFGGASWVAFVLVAALDLGGFFVSTRRSRS